jgi:hypothetical protein
MTMGGFNNLSFDILCNHQKMRVQCLPELLLHEHHYCSRDAAVGKFSLFSKHHPQHCCHLLSNCSFRERLASNSDLIKVQAMSFDTRTIIVSSAFVPFRQPQLDSSTPRTERSLLFSCQPSSYGEIDRKTSDEDEIRATARNITTVL